MEVTVNLDEQLYVKFCEIASKNGKDSGDIQKILFENAMRNWIGNNDENLSAMDKLDLFMDSFCSDKGW